MIEPPEGGVMTREEQATLPETQSSKSGMTREETGAFVKHRIEAYEDLDAATLAADYAADAVIETPSTGKHAGRDAEKNLRVIFDAFLDLTMSVDDVVIDGDKVVTVHTVEGTHMQELFGLAPTGKRFQMATAFIYELKDRKIIHEQRIYDFTGMLVQIGLLKARPAS
jgi:predicted ester cyclase